MKQYTHIFFDLDRTLWDFEQNSRQTLVEIIHQFKLEKDVRDHQKFIQAFNHHNDNLWNDLRDGKVRKPKLRVERFRRTLQQFGLVNKGLIDEVSSFYLQHAPAKKRLVEGAIEILEYLYAKYGLYIVTNGFYDVQVRKLRASGIDHFFRAVYTSDRLHCAKPKIRFYTKVLKMSQANTDGSLVVGDDFINDVLGASYAGIDQVFFNPSGLAFDYLPTYSIYRLSELKQIL